MRTRCRHGVVEGFGSSFALEVIAFYNAPRGVSASLAACSRSKRERSKSQRMTTAKQRRAPGELSGRDDRKSTRGVGDQRSRNISGRRREPAAIVSEISVRRQYRGPIRTRKIVRTRMAGCLHWMTDATLGRPESRVARWQMEELMQKAISVAMGGDVGVMRAVLDRLLSFDRRRAGIAYSGSRQQADGLRDLPRKPKEIGSHWRSRQSAANVRRSLPLRQPRPRNRNI